EVSGADYAVTRACHLRSICGIEKPRIETREAAVLVERLAEIRMTHAVVDGQILTKTPLVLNVTLKRVLAEICDVVETRLCERYVVSQQEVGKVLKVCASCGVSFAGCRIGSQDAGLNDACGNSIEKSAETAGVVA